MNKEERERFTLGVILFGLGLLTLMEKQLQATIFLFVLGIAFMSSANIEFAKEVWGVFWGGFIKLLKIIFGPLFK